MPAWLTIILTGLATAAPAFISAVPHEYQAAGSAIIAMGAAIYHLFQPSPSDR